MPLHPPSAGADLQHHTALITGVTGEQGKGELLLECIDLTSQLAELVLDQGLHFGIPLALARQLLSVLQLLLQALPMAEARGQGLKPGPFLGETA